MRPLRGAYGAGCESGVGTDQHLHQVVEAVIIGVSGGVVRGVGRAEAVHLPGVRQAIAVRVRSIWNQRFGIRAVGNAVAIGISFAETCAQLYLGGIVQSVEVCVGQARIAIVKHHFVVGRETVAIVVVDARIEQTKSAPAQFETVNYTVGVTEGVGLSAAVVLSTHHEIRPRKSSVGCRVSRQIVPKGEVAVGKKF